MDSGLFALLYPIEWVVAWIMTGAHWLFANIGFGHGPDRRGSWPSWR
ncbi:hypothetical protein [Xylanimonas allomyrinae]